MKAKIKKAIAKDLISKVERLVPIKLEEGEWLVVTAKDGGNELSAKQLDDLLEMFKVVLQTENIIITGLDMEFSKVKK